MSSYTNIHKKSILALEKILLELPSSHENAQKALLLAIENHCFASCRFLLTFQNIKDIINCEYSWRGNKTTPLLLACQHEYLEICQLLISFGASANVIEPHTLDTPLSIACRKKNEELCRLLIPHTKDLETINKEGLTPLSIVCKASESKIFSLLLLSKVNPNNPQPTFGTPLSFCCLAGNLGMCTSLIKFGAHVNYFGAVTFLTPLQIAVGKGHVEVCKALIAAGANVNLHIVEKTQPPLIYAAVKGNLEVMKVLIAAGASLNICSTLGSGTALARACVEGNIQVCELLLKQNNVNPAAVQCKEGLNALHLAASNGHVDICELLIHHHKVDVDLMVPTDSPVHGFSALFFACEKGHIEVCKLLIENNASVDSILQETQVSPLIVAAKNGHKEICELLIDSGASLNFPMDGNNALLYAAGNGHADVCKILMEKGIQIQFSSSVLLRETGLRELFISEAKRRMRGVNMLLLCARYFCPESHFSRGKLPDQVFRKLLGFSGLARHSMVNIPQVVVTHHSEEHEAIDVLTFMSCMKKRKIEEK